MKHKHWLVKCFTLLPIWSLCGQANDSVKLSIPPHQYIEYMRNYINLKFAHTSEEDELSVVNDDNDIFLKPNASSYSQLFFNYRFISFSIKYIPKWLPGNDDNDIKGTTKGGGFGANLNFDKWQQAFSYSKTRGYYLENTSDYDPGWSEGDPYVQFPKLEFINYQGITSYKFNANYSLNAVALQTERQLRSAGSFIPHLLYRYYIIDNKVALQPNESSQKSKNFEILLGVGYYHTFVIKNNFYISLGATPGIGSIFTKLTTRLPSGDEYSNQKNAIFRMDGRAGAGFNGSRFFAGIYSTISASSEQQQNTSVINQDARLIVQGFLGYRLNAPKWMKDKVDDAGRIIGQ